MVLVAAGNSDGPGRFFRLHGFGKARAFGAVFLLAAFTITAVDLIVETRQIMAAACFFPIMAPPGTPSASRTTARTADAVGARQGGGQP